MQFRTATVLGLLGLIPFFVLTIFILIHPYNGHALLSFYVYAATVLCFLGGINWGLLAQARNVAQTRFLKGYWIWSVMPPIICWLAIWLAPFWAGLLILTVAFIAQYVIDVRLAQKNLMPYWLLQLRRVLTLLAVLCMLVVLGRLW